ncbi:MAG TPA: PAS domain-containing protein [Planctomycetaceae bacterium]|nr:PAS domain-containing protein [Planctomycetaceae bacterium]
MKKKPSRKRRKLADWLASEGTPVFLLDAARRIVFFNAGCERLTGWSAEDVVGEVCEYTTDGDQTAPRTLTGVLCPPPEVLHGHVAQVPVYLPHKTGGTRARLLHFFPLTDPAGQIEAILGIAAALPEAKARVEPTLAQRLHAELAALRLSLRQRFGNQSLVGHNDAMRRVLRQVHLATHSEVPVLLIGEPGTGKEHVARVIHSEGPTKPRAFVPLDCRLLPADRLAEAITRAVDGEHPETAAAGLTPGTLYLAHVEHLPRELQQQIAQAFGADGTPNRHRLRLIAATTVDPWTAREEDRLRDDLCHLLTALTIALPPLRDRLDDLPYLAQAFVESFNRDSEKQVGGISESVLDQFRRYNWPGNLDELRSVIQEAWSACSEAVIRPTDLPFRFRTGMDAQTVGPPRQLLPMPLEEYLAAVEKEHIQQALERSRYNKTKAAELLGITRPRLYRRMQALGIEDRED